MQNFSQLLQRLADAGLDFVIVGGFAGITLGSACLTRDADIHVVLSDENRARRRQALREWNPTHRMTPQRLPLLLCPRAGEPVAADCQGTPCNHGEARGKLTGANRLPLSILRPDFSTDARK